MKRDTQVKEKILAALRRSRQTVEAIATQLGKRPSTVYQTLRVLEERGEVQRTPGSHGGGDPQIWYIPDGPPLGEIRRASLGGEVKYEGLEIESGIPIPPERTSQTGFVAALRKMKVGDSVLLQSPRGGYRYAAARDLGVKIVSRKLGKNKIRIWRVK